MEEKHFKELQETGITTLQLLTSFECDRLISETTAYDTTKLAPRKYGERNVDQNFFETTIDLEKSPNVKKAVTQITRYLSTSLAERYDKSVFEKELSFTQVRVHKYLASIGGLGYHKDRTEWRNLIVSILLRGESCFYTADDTSGTNERLIEIPVGYGIIMAAPGLFGKEVRPPHCVKNLTSERWSMILGQKITTQ